LRRRWSRYIGHGSIARRRRHGELDPIGGDIADTAAQLGRGDAPGHNRGHSIAIALCQGPFGIKAHVHLPDQLVRVIGLAHQPVQAVRTALQHSALDQAPHLHRRGTAVYELRGCHETPLVDRKVDRDFLHITLNHELIVSSMVIFSPFRW
jgi:hypothetical protein